MTEVDFFIWPLCKKQLHDLAICNLIHSLYHSEGSLVVHIDDTERRQYFNALLWTFEETSFLPHGINADWPIYLAADYNDCTKSVLVNLGRSCPPEPRKFEKIIETAGHDELTRTYARRKFKSYRDNGIGVSSHQLKTSEAAKTIII